MSGQLKNGLLWAGVILLTIIPLLSIRPDAQRTEIFTGADTQAEGVIQQLNPDYQPWFDSLLKPPSVEIESLLFALQAAIGAGVIGYYAGYVRGKKSAAKGRDDRAD